MITFPMLPGIEINMYLLIFTGLGAGIVSGFTGVGGGFLITPALLVLGFPANLAVGTSLTWVLGNCIVGGFRHGRLGNIDIRLGLVMVVAATGGMEVGVRILNWIKRVDLADEGVLSIAIVLLLIVGTYTLVESVRRKRHLDRILKQGGMAPPMGASPLAQRLQRMNLPPMVHFSGAQVTISLWVMLVIGFCIGVLAGIVGVGGGFVTVPSLIYLLGVPSFVAVGTSLFQTAISAAYGAARHSMSGNVVIFASFVMLVASSIGVQFGALTTRYVRAVSVRYILGICILLSAAGSALKLYGVLLGERAAWTGTGSLIVIFGGLGLGVVMIVALLVIAVRHRNGGNIPSWARSLMSDTDN
jgi:uncharacterized membrane protein YfcA